MYRILNLSLDCSNSFMSVRLNIRQYAVVNVLNSVSLPSGDGEIRTHDPLLARQVLSQLSYTPISSALKPW